MQHAERQIALGQCGHDDAEAEDVADLGEAQVLFTHLSVDRKKSLLAAEDLDFQLGLVKRFLDIALNALDHVAAVAACLQQRLR